ncbi:hypothetical protein AAG906_003366 [Vitis piasezkii]
MDKTEPALVPEWLKSSGSVTGGGSTNHHFAPSLLQSGNPECLDDGAALKPARKLMVNSNDHDTGRSSNLERTTSSYFRRSSSSNGSGHPRSFSSFGRTNREREWEKDIHDYRDKDKSVLSDHRHHDYSDPLGNILPGRLERDMLRRSQSMITGKRGDMWPRKVAADVSTVNKTIHSNGDGQLASGIVTSSVQKAAFDRNFPSLGAEDKQGAPDIGRVTSPGLTSAIQSLPIGNTVVIGGDGWTSALAEVPVIIGSNTTGVSSVQQSVSASSVSVAPSTTSGLNMAETLVQGPARARANATPQLSVGTQRLEELALKQSRQLIPMTPSMPKTLVPSPSDKPKSKIGLQPLHLVNHSQRGGPARSDVTKTSNVGKLHVLKPSRERNGVSPIAKDSLSPTMGSRVANSPLAVTPSAAGSASLRSPRNNPTLASAERRPSVVLTSVEKRPTSQAQSRNDFFNLMRKKSSTNPPSAVPESGPAVSSSVSEKSDELITEVGDKTENGNNEACGVSQNDRDDEIDNVNGDACDVSQRDQGDEVHDGNGDACDVSQKFLDNGEKHSSPDEVLYPDEEEAAFLRSLGWEENEKMKALQRRRLMLSTRRMLPKISPLLDSQMGSVAGAVSGLSSSDSS